MTDEFTKDEIEFGEQHAALGPDYKRAERISREIMEKFKAEHFQPLVDQFAKEFVDRLWRDVEDYLIADTELNLQSKIRDLSEASISALLGGNRPLAERYSLKPHCDPTKIRAAIFEQFKDELIEIGIAERDEKIEELKEQLKWYRGG